MEKIEEKVFNKLNKIADEGYKAFHSRLVPNIGEFLGCRVPDIKKLAKDLTEEERLQFVCCLPHKFYDENMLHAMCLCKINCPTNVKLKMLDEFLPYVDNWAVCDSLCCGLFKKSVDSDNVFRHALNCLKGDKTYIVRYGIVMLMSHFIDRYNEIMPLLIDIKNEDYYVLMAIAWFMSTLLVKHYDEGIAYFEVPHFNKFVHNKSLQKTIESYRISDDKKQYLKTLKK